MTAENSGHVAVATAHVEQPVATTNPVLNKAKGAAFLGVIRLGEDPSEEVVAKMPNRPLDIKEAT